MKRYEDLMRGLTKAEGESWFIVEINNEKLLETDDFEEVAGILSNMPKGTHFRIQTGDGGTPFADGTVEDGGLDKLMEEV